MGFIGNGCDEVVRLTSVKEEWWSKGGYVRERSGYREWLMEWVWKRTKDGLICMVTVHRFLIQYVERLPTSSHCECGYEALKLFFLQDFS